VTAPSSLKGLGLFHANRSESFSRYQVSPCSPPHDRGYDGPPYGDKLIHSKIA
jgi:hypothetical protein